jgi:hypothetical protein
MGMDVHVIPIIVLGVVSLKIELLEIIESVALKLPNISQTK